MTQVSGTLCKALNFAYGVGATQGVDWGVRTCFCDPNGRLAMSQEGKQLWLRLLRPYAEILTPIEEIVDFPKRLEVAGRTCWKSEGRITDTSALSFVAMICKRGHESVLEHCSITVRIVCSRACSHQLVRHRIGSYSQVSLRYVNQTKRDALQIILPEPLEAILDLPAHPETQAVYVSHDPYPDGPIRCITSPPCPEPDLVKPGCDRTVFDQWASHALLSYATYSDLVRAGWNPEDARFVLPIGVQTEVVTTYNLRQWRHVFIERALNKAAQWEIRRVTGSLLERLGQLLPCVL